MILSIDEDPYLICPYCGKAFGAWESECWMQDAYTDGSEEVDAPEYFSYKSCDDTHCPHCDRWFDLYGYYEPEKFIVKGKKGTVVMSLEEVTRPPMPKGNLFGMPSGGLFAAPEKKLFALRNVKAGVKGMRVCPNPRKGQRRWS